MQRVLLFIKGVLMGLADVVPGVSGGTVAFVLGIYEAFMAALSSVNLRWAFSLILYVFSGFKKHHLEQFKHHFFRIHWGFLLTLLTGMATAIVLGSVFIPALMENYPVQMRAFFMGLVLASIAVPWSEIGRKTVPLLLLTLATAVGVFFLLGAKGEAPVRWTEATVTAEVGLRDFTRLHPGTQEPVEVYCPSESTHDNASLRARVASGSPETAAQLDDLCAKLAAAKHDTQALAAVRTSAGIDHKTTDPYSQLTVPAGSQIWVAKPALWFIFLAGAIAICAMVLPGISGSFILLMLGVYYFVFSSIRGSISFALGRSDSPEAVLYVLVFGLGVLLGVMSFSRVLTMLFREYRDATLATLVGVLIGALPVLWPFQVGSLKSGAAENVWPTAADPLLAAVLLCVAGFILVLGLAKLSRALEPDAPSPPA